MLIQFMTCIQWHGAMSEENDVNREQGIKEGRRQTKEQQNETRKEVLKNLLT